MWLCVRILQESTTYWNDYSLEDLKKKKGLFNERSYYFRDIVSSACRVSFLVNLSKQRHLK